MDHAPLPDGHDLPTTPETLLALLVSLGIPHETVRHEPVFTVEESSRVNARYPALATGVHIKNLFLRNKREEMWLVVAEAHRPIDLKKLGERIVLSGVALQAVLFALIALLTFAFADRAPADDAWLPALRETLASDPGWIAEAAATVLADPPAPPPPEAGATYRTADRPDADDDPLPHRGRVLLVLAALCLVFGLGLAAGRLAPWESAAPPPAAPAALVPEPAPEPAPIAERGPAAITAVTPDLPEDPASLLPALPATDPVPVPAAAAAPPPPEPIAAPPRIVRHRPPAYDRACSQAQFRWQRGDTLSAADMAYVHNGCAPTRLR